MKTLVTIIGLILLTATSAWDQDVATVRIYECAGKNYSSILLVQSSGETEIIPLFQKALNGIPDKENAAIIENQKLIKNLFQRMFDEGFEVKQTTAPQFGGVTERFVVFEKKRKGTD